MPGKSLLVFPFLREGGMGDGASIFLAQPYLRDAASPDGHAAFAHSLPVGLHPQPARFVCVASPPRKLCNLHGFPQLCIFFM